MDYKELKQRFKNSELIIHKKNSNFIEKLLNHLNYDISHDNYKKIINAKRCPETNSERKIKRVFDSYSFLLANRKLEFSEGLLKTFYYILTQKELDYEVILKIQSHYYNYIDVNAIEKIMDTHFYLYDAFSYESKENQLIISILILNFLLASYEYTTIVIHKNQYQEYEEIKRKYFNGNKISGYLYIIEKLKEERLQPKTYYRNLLPLSLKEIYAKINEDKDLICKMFQVNKMAIYGSFSKEIERIDSDIDLIVIFNEDITYEAKVEKSSQLKEYLFCKFSRYLDIHDTSKIVFEDFIYSTKKFKSIF